MFKYALIALVVALGLVSIVFLNKESNNNSNPDETSNGEKIETPIIKNQVQKTSLPEKPSENNFKEIQQTQKELIEKIEDAPEKIAASNRPKKIRTKDGFMMLYDTEGRLIKKAFPDGKIELYNYTREGEKILVEN